MSEQQDVNDFIKAIKDAGMTMPDVEDKSKKREALGMDNKKSFKDRLRDGELTYDDIPENIKTDWVRSILGNTPFSYKVSVLGGKVNFVFCDLNQEGMANYRKYSDGVGRDIEAQTKLGIVVFLHSITGELNVELDANKFPTVSEAGQDVIDVVNDMYDKLCSKLPVGLVRMLPAAWAMYSTLIAFLTSNALPDSF